MSFTRPFLLGPVFFRAALPRSGSYYLERGGMSLHDAVGINCKNGLLKIKAQMSSMWANGCVFDNCVLLSDLTSLPLLGEGRKT